MKSLTTFFQRFYFAACLLTTASSQVLAAPTCASVFKETKSVRQKTIATLMAPSQKLWNQLVYSEDPHYFSHPLYKSLQQKFPDNQAKSIQSFLYYVSNGFRKVYNFFSTKGLGLPLPPIPTNYRYPLTDGHTYWYDFAKLTEKTPGFLTAQTIAKKTASAVVLMATAIFAVHTFGNITEVLQSKSVIVQPEMSLARTMPLKNSQIQILNETTPFPHTSIRIGNTVFSHGVQHLTQTPVDVYLHSHQLAARPKAIADERTASLSSFYFHSAMLKRSVDTIVLNLDEHTVLNIRDQLIQEVNKPYKNETFVNSCASMIARALKEQGVTLQDLLLDASPSLIMSRLALESASGKKNKDGKNLIEGIYSLEYGKENTPFLAMRNFLIRELDAAIHLQIYTLPFRLAQRAQINLEHPQLQNLYQDGPERQKAIVEFMEQAEKDLTMIQTYQLYSLEKEKALREGQDSSLSSLKEKYATEFNKMLSDYEQIIRSPSISFEDYHLTRFKIDLLRQALAP